MFEPVSIIFIALGLIVTIMSLLNDKSKVDYLFLGVLLLVMAGLFLLEFPFCSVVVRPKLLLGIGVATIFSLILLAVGKIKKLSLQLTKSNLLAASAMFSITGVILLGLLLGNNYRGGLAAMIVPIAVVLVGMLLLLYAKTKK
ncbi:hypothetical protein PT285_00385 [Lactobacillus sp. ESL0791]|uniref:hypothetical protein n=1 Tax=Lactobacillus sp. ESL0791 TaxID=2983234 RepID=UPI0023F75DDE|nr:hypothetical protein [Lactobacillus sp. ESL0791]MDF7637896.1 hypothetical protein [Lactobacillus sp. ESL0791]